jgi:glycosyltransferase involved in cell wall biosynthesis
MNHYNPLEGKKSTLSFSLHDGSDEKVTLIIVHKDKPEYLSMCLQSIAICSVNSNIEIVVVDNNSEKKDSIDYLSEIESQGIKVVRNNKNLYWSPAINKGVEVASKASKYYIFMHCDVTVLTPGWLDVLINIADSKNSGMVGVELNSYEMSGQKYDFIEDWCVLVTKDCWKAIGPYNEDLPLLGSSFIFTIKAQQNNFNPQVIKNESLVHHWKMFSIKYSDYEKFVEKARRDLAQILIKMQSENV